MYFELISHKNKFIRKFASQSFSFVIRKLPFNTKLMALLAKPLNLTVKGEVKDEEMEIVGDPKVVPLEKMIGLADLIFEVAYGANEGLHSRASEVIPQLITFSRDNQVVHRVA